MVIKTLIREPLVHFLALGAVIFGVNAVFNPEVAREDRVVEITAADVERIGKLYTQQWGGTPSPAELPKLVDDYVRQEILFREGRALKLDLDDSVVRNRMVQKMDFLINDPAAVTMPDDAEVDKYYAQHKEKYAVPERVGFTHIFFSVSARDERQAEADAKASLATLTANPSDTSQRGDPFIINYDPSPKPLNEVTKDFGLTFSSALLEAPDGAWSGPVRSAYGLHLVRVLAREPAHVPALADVRRLVASDIITQRQTDHAARAYQDIKARYVVIIRPDALAEKASP
ncbi:MAG: peptidyl-prolyl cis-trans isomerase [Rhodospirillaceae bacterium]|nr:peptidyl-prolyl cis-trans isomerase [Rhodospirillaceae bacterium]